MDNAQDREIANKIENALRNEMQLSSLDINISVKNGVVLLSGMVDTLAEKAFAQEIANQIPGVQKVENNLTIATDGTLTDDEIAANIERHLREGEESERLQNVGVKVEGGSAVLMGEVENLSDKNHAILAAQKAAGVKDVVSNIKLKPEADAPLTDDQITNRVVQLFSTSGINLPDVSVETQHQIVTLRGYVEGRHLAELAEELAMTVEGVKKINNMLKIRNK